jgi:hypothetical protein
MGKSEAVMKKSIVVAGGLGGAAITVYLLFNGGMASFADSWLLFTLMFAVLVGFFLWLAARQRHENLQRRLLVIIRSLGGRTTAAQLAQHGDISLRKTREFLETKVRNGQAVTVQNDAEVLYIFDGFVNQSGGRGLSASLLAGPTAF